MKSLCNVILILLFSFILYNCNSDSSNKANSVPEEEVENLVDDLLEEQMAEMEGEPQVENEVEVDMTEVDVDQAAIMEQKKEILKEQLKESPNLGKDCEDILKEYATLVDQFLKGENEEGVLNRLAEWANDPIFNRCKKSEEYKDRFFKLEEKMYAGEEEGLGL